jgi:DNA modification methylase
MIEPNGIYHGNCNLLMEEVEPESIDLICFSPPYDEIRDYNGFSLDLPLLGKQLYKAAKPGAVCAVVMTDATDDGAKSLTTFRLAVDWADNAGWRMFEHCIYSRFGRPGAWWNQRFRVDHEYILLFVKGQRPRFFDKEPLKIKAKHAGETWHGTTRLTNGTLVKNEKKVQSDLKCRGTIWHYSTSNTEGNKRKLQHPATYPDALAGDLIRCFSQRNDVVLDPTLGSGTTAVMAAKLGRKYIGFDISEDYLKIAQDRLAREPKQDMYEGFESEGDQKES